MREGLVVHDYKNFFFQNRLTVKNLKKLEFYFCWGYHQKNNAIKSFKNFKEKFVISGGIIGADWFKKKKITKKNLVFFTSFGNYNHHTKIKKFGINLQKRMYKFDKRRSKIIDNYYNYLKKLYNDYLILIPEIADCIFS